MFDMHEMSIIANILSEKIQERKIKYPLCSFIWKNTHYLESYTLFFFNQHAAQMISGNELALQLDLPPTVVPVCIQ